MFTDKENFKRLLNVEKLNFEYLDNVTLIDWELIRFENDINDDMKDSWICVEVWTDENNAIKILEQTDTETEEITKELTEEVLLHIYKLVNIELKKLNEIKS